MKLNNISENLISKIPDFKGGLKGAYSIRENGKCVGRRSTENVTIESKEGKPGMIVTVKPGTKGETIFIPTCVTTGGMDDLVYNDFYIGEDCDVKIISGCGVHTDSDSMAKHSGVHHLILAKNAVVHYEEKHIGDGTGDGTRSINPVTTAELGPGSYLEINATQISGVDNAYRKTNVTLAENAKLIVRERLFTEGEQKTQSHFKVELNGDGSSVDLISRAVAKDRSSQKMDSVIVGNAVCSGHSECDAIIDDEAVVDASPCLYARNKEASLIHEAAIGKIAGEQILKLCSLGLTEKEAEAAIISGFLS